VGDWKKDRCRTCGAEIVWATTEKGKAIPIDATPNLLQGNISLESSADPREGPLAKFAKKGESGSYVSHFATCPQASEHRK
jgi:hypothetical protein